MTAGQSQTTVPTVTLLARMMG